jgi:KRAB domain-containing zinc finger protein
VTYLSVSQKHLILHPANIFFAGSQCETSLQDLGPLQANFRDNNIENSYGCSQCIMSFLEIKELQKHVNSHPGERSFMTYKCSQCSKLFATAQSLQQHVALHAGVKPNLCDLCSESFAQVSALQSHMQVHIGELPNNFSLCTKSSSQRYARKVHMRKRTDETKPHKCSYCAKSFLSVVSLQLHEKKHIGENSFNCS